MKYFIHLSLLMGSVLALGACEYLKPRLEDQRPVVMMEEPAPVQRFDMSKSEIAAALSNENVIVYAVDEAVNENKREFPEYRGVIENTTAGGYTVFDPSVTVYAVEGATNMRPSYLPRYSVPQYAEQYAPAIVEPMYMKQQRNQPLTPMAGVSLQTPTPIVTRSPRPWLENQRDVNVGTPRAPQQQVQAQSAARRSPPVLTGY